MKALLPLQVLALLTVGTVTCSRHTHKEVLVHYFPFARSPYAPIQLPSAEHVPGTFSFAVDGENASLQKVVASLGQVERGAFDRQDIRLVIRFENGEFVAVDAKGGVLNRGREGQLSPERVKAVAATLEAMPENPLHALTKD